MPSFSEEKLVEPENPRRSQISGELLKRIFREAQKDRLTSEAAKAAYYFFVSFFPTILALFALTGILGGDAAFEWTMPQLYAALPDDAAAYLSRFVLEVTGESRPGLLWLALLLTVWREEDLQSSETSLLEVLVAPGSALEGKTLKETGFRQIYGGTALAIRHRGELMRERLGTTQLRSGDVLLVEVRRDRIEALKRIQDFVIVSEIGLDEPRRNKLSLALAIVAGTVAAATLGFLPIVGSAILVTRRIP